MIKNIKEQIVDKFFPNKTIPIIFSVWILSLTAYYCINTPWLRFLSDGRSDTKELIAETLKFHWVPVFLSRLPYVFYALILNFIALLMGSRILRWLKADFDSYIDRIIFSVPLGWSVYSIGIFWLGISKLLYVEAVYCFLTLLGVLSILEIKRFFNPPHPTPLPLGERIEVRGRFKIDKTDLVFLPMMIIFFAVQLVTSFSPVWSNDALVYHMALPKLYIKHHALIHIPGLFFSTLPSHTEMLYLLGLITSGETLSKLFSFSISLMFLISIFSIGTKYFSKGAAYLAALIMMQASLFFSPYFTEPWTDIALGLFSLLGVYAFFMWIEGKRGGYLYLSIVCCALAAATKMQGLFFVPLFFVGFFVTVKRDRYFLKKLAWCIMVVSVIALPWYIRSWWLTGDPVFPFLYKYLGAKHWNECSNGYFWEFLSEWKGAKSFSDFIRINKDLFLSGFGISSFTPIIMVFLIPALITLRNWNTLIRYLFFITFLYYIFLIFTSPQFRFYYVCFAILSIIVAHFIKTVWTKYLLTRVPIVLCIITFSVLYFFGFYSSIGERPFFAGLGVLDRKQFLNDSPYEYLRESSRAAAWINENLPHDSKILCWGTRTGYYLDWDYIAVNPAFQSILDFSMIIDTPTFLKSIKKLGVTHLLYCESDLTSPRGNVKEFLSRCVSELLQSGEITLIKQFDNSAIYTVNAR